MYKPKKKKYNDLCSLHKEMKENGVSPMAFDGASILTKGHKYVLYDGNIIVTER